MATIKNQQVSSKVTRVYTLENGTEVEVMRDEAAGIIRCFLSRVNSAQEGVAQKPTTLQVQYAIAQQEVNIKTVNFPLEGDIVTLDEIEECVLDLANWSVDGE